MDLPGHGLYKFKPTLRFESLPMVAPLYNGFTMRTKFYFVPYRLYMPLLRRNVQMPWKSIQNLLLPELQIHAEGPLTGAAGYTSTLASLKGSLLERLGIACGEFATFQSFKLPSYKTSSDANSLMDATASLIPLLAYIDAWLYGEYNPQDKNIPVDFDRITIDTNTMTRVYGRNFVSYEALRSFVDFYAGFNNDFIESYLGPAVSDYDQQITPEMKSILQVVASTGQSSVPLVSYETNARWIIDYPFLSAVKVMGTGSLTQNIADNWKTLTNITSAVGLLPVTYKGDYFTSWYNEEGINLLKDYKVTANDSFLSLRQKRDNFIVEAMALVSGNRYTDYLQYIFDTNLELKDHPIMVGYDEVDFGTIDVLAQSNTGDGTTGVLGASASKAREYESTVKPLSFKTLEPGLFMTCVGIEPNVVYYQGSNRFHFLRQFSDFWHPQYSSQGFDAVFRAEVFNPYAVPNVQNTSEVLGDPNILMTALNYVPLGWSYMMKYNSISGGMLTDMFKPWTLQRDVAQAQNTTVIGDTTVSQDFDPFTNFDASVLTSTYVNTSLFNHSFANDNSADCDNFIFKISYDCSCYMPMSHELITKNML